MAYICGHERSGKENGEYCFTTPHLVVQSFSVMKDIRLTTSHNLLFTKSDLRPKASQSGDWRWPFWSSNRSLCGHIWTSRHTYLWKIWHRESHQPIVFEWVLPKLISHRSRKKHSEFSYLSLWVHSINSAMPFDRKLSLRMFSDSS